MAHGKQLGKIREEAMELNSSGKSVV